MKLAAIWEQTRSIEEDPCLEELSLLLLTFPIAIYRQQSDWHCFVFAIYYRFRLSKTFPIGIYILSMKTLRLSFSLCLTPIAQYWIFVTNENSSDIQCMWNKLFTNKGYVQDIIFPILWSVVLNYQTLCVSIMFLWRP